MKRKLVAILTLCAMLALCVVGVIGCNGNTADNREYSKGLDFELNKEQTGYILTGAGYCGDIKVVIPSEYNDKPVVAIGERAFYQVDFIKTVEIPSKVTSIGDDAFCRCNNLKSVTFEENSKLESIGFRAFSDCDSLESIEIPSSVTSIGYAFSSCSNLKSVTFGENSKLESIGFFAFSSCKSLESIEIPSSVTSIGGGAFRDCSNLKSVTFGENSKLESIANSAFSSCKSLESIEIPSRVTSIGNYAFNECSKLTIYCQATSKPSGWNFYWNYSNCPVVWGYKG